MLMLITAGHPVYKNAYSNLNSLTFPLTEEFGTVWKILIYSLVIKTLHIYTKCSAKAYLEVVDAVIDDFICGCWPHCSDH